MRTFDGTVRATHEQLKVALGIVSKDAIGTRIHDALTAGVIEITNPAAARSAGGCYRVKVGSAALRAAAGIPVFPTPAMVETMINDPVKLKAALEAIAAEQAAEEDVGAEGLMTILMTILSSEMVGFPYPAYPAFPACSRQGPSLLSSIFLPRFPRLFAALSR